MSGKLKEVRERISSVQSTQQITKAMKMVSAAKLRNAQNAITQMRPYAKKLDKMIKNILSNIDPSEGSSFGQKRELKNAAVVVITSNRGLAGAFNTNIAKAAYTLYEKYENLASTGNLTFYFIGKKGMDNLKKRIPGANINTDYINLFNDLSFEKISEVADMLMASFETADIDHVDVCYGEFKNAGVQNPIAVQYLPVPKVTGTMQNDKSSNVDYIFEPSKKVLLDQLVPSILQTTFQKFCLDTHASEHGARMTAMDKATENAGELIKELKISYNKARQESITKEILEIVGGAAALEN